MLPNISRRELLKLLGLTVASNQIPLLTTTNAFAQTIVEKEPHYFFHLQIEGSMDMICTLDPYLSKNTRSESELYFEYSPNELVEAGNLILGPSASPLKRHANDIALINGIWMSIGGLSSHEACRTYMSTGSTDYSTQTIFPFEIAFHQPSSTFGVVANTSREAKNKSRDSVGIKVLDSPNESLADGATMNSDTIALKNIFGDLGSLDVGIGASKQDYFNVFSFAERFDSGIKKLRSSSGEIDFEHQVSVAFQEGGCYSAFYNLGGDYNGPGPRIDDHSGYQKDHMVDSLWFMEKIASIFDLFKSIESAIIPGKSLFDLTTFIVTNEFSKTAGLYGSGKDHNTATNSVLLAGKNVVGGQAVGKSEFYEKKDIGGISMPWGSKSEIFGLPFDFTSGKPVDVNLQENLGKAMESQKELSLIKPENVAATLREIMGIEASSFKNVDNKTAFLKSLVKNS